MPRLISMPAFGSRMSAVAGALAHRSIRPLLDRINMRARWWELGHFPLRTPDRITTLSIAGKSVRFAFPPDEQATQQWELNHIYMDDPYALARLPGDIRTVLDVGANIGLFAALARHRFPQAIIHCYEPNPDIAPLLESNVADLEIEVFRCGIGFEPGEAALLSGTSSLTGQLALGAEGLAVRIESLHNALAGIGGGVDLLKLDCEGGEWAILRDRASLEKARFLSMEYHLDAPGSRPLWELVREVKACGFSIQHLKEADSADVGLLIARNTRCQ